MAQQGTRPRRGRLAQRFGVMGRAGVAAAVVTLLSLGVVAVTARDALGGGVVIERAAGEADEAEAPEHEVLGADGEEGGDVAEEGQYGDPGSASSDVASPVPIVVHVDGAVASPGVYELPASSRVNDAVLAAGGLASGADTSGLNLAAPLADGDKVHVPLEGEAAPAAAGAGSAGGVAGDDGSAGPVNINVAGIEELDQLPGVGEATARAIVEDRERNGPFSTTEDLMRVSGIGEKKFAKLEGMICVR